MFPHLHVGSFAVSTYGLAMAVAFAAAFWMKRAESRRLQYASNPRFAWVGVGALAGAVIGSKVGMLLYVAPSAWLQVVADMTRFELGGKTVVGGIAGGYLGVELAKKLVGLRHSTGDAFAVALPLGQGVGRIGCLLGGCCYGAPSALPWAVWLRGTSRHPVQLYEALLDFTLAAALFAVRKQPRVEGHLFRTFLIGYAVIRFALDLLRGDEHQMLFGLSLAQIACALAAIGFALNMSRSRAQLRHAER